MVNIHCSVDDSKACKHKCCPWWSYKLKDKELNRKGDIVFGHLMSGEADLEKYDATLDKICQQRGTNDWLYAHEQLWAIKVGLGYGTS